MSDAGVVAFLATLPLLEGRDDAELAELARVLRRRSVRAGEVLWRQGDEARELVIVVHGGLSASLSLDGERAVAIGSAGPGDVVGEIGLLDGRGHSMSVRASEDATLLALSRMDFAALLSGLRPPAFALKRHLAAVLTARLRGQLRHLAESLGGPPGAPDAGAVQAAADLEPSGPPDSRYVRRMAVFRDVDPLALWGFLTSGTYVRCPRGRTLLAEGIPPAAAYLTINGAVEQVLARGDRRIRVGLAGPGRAFGHEGLVDGGPAPVTAVTRERALLLVLPPDRFDRLLHGEDAVSRGFVDVVLRELTTTVRDTLRPYARLAASV